MVLSERPASVRWCCVKCLPWFFVVSATASPTIGFSSYTDLVLNCSRGFVELALLLHLYCPWITSLCDVHAFLDTQKRTLELLLIPNCRRSKVLYSSSLNRLLEKIAQHHKITKTWSGNTTYLKKLFSLRSLCGDQIRQMIVTSWPNMQPSIQLKRNSRLSKK